MSSQHKTTTSDEKDEELDNLLASALEDFENPLPNRSGIDVESSNKKKVPGSYTEQVWNDEFLQETQKQFEKNMKSLLEDGNYSSDVTPEQFGEQLFKMAEGASKVLMDNSADSNFSATIAETLQNLSENSDNLQAEIGDDIATMLGSLNLDSRDGVPDIYPFMQNMMQSFLSKEVLYPCIKEIVDKYPNWLEEHKDELSKSDFDNFNQQLGILRDVCSEFEKESLNESSETKKLRFDKILSLMENMQKLGHPPKDLVGNSPFTFDENGSPNLLPGISSPQCNIM
ncbi:hypothetical protein AAG570_007023 [Ranatra chinensis]|uniref:Peroxin-19 n=1 Tax=Ranatra chinensis TaxID=642074 RepID=A0ABD0YWE3_9HEMI